MTEFGHNTKGLVDDALAEIEKLSVEMKAAEKRISDLSLEVFKATGLPVTGTPRTYDYDETDITGLLRREAKSAGSQKALASLLGVNPCFLGDVIGNRRRPPDSMASKLGLKRRVVFIKLGARS